MQLVGTIGGLDLPCRFLLIAPLESWHGLFVSQRFYGPFYTGIGVSAGWLVICLGIAVVLLRRRDITGG